MTKITFSAHERTDSNRHETTRNRPQDERERQHEHERTDEHEATVTCPECGGRLESERTETICAECGLVVDEDEVDRGPEWRAFDAAERDEKSRVGAPTTKMLHDEGLSSTIGWQNKDAYGSTLSSRQRRTMQRLRTWDERFRTRNHKERNLKQALGEIDRMASALGLPESVRETASMIYRQALERDLLPGRSIEGVATASLHAAARMEGVPRSVDEMVTVSRVDEQEFTRAYRYINRELGLEIQPADPLEYLPRFASELALEDETERRARELLELGRREGLHVGKSPVGLAAAAIYAAALLTDAELTQHEVSEVTEMSEVTIRNRYQELLAAEEASRLDPDGGAVAEA